MPAARSLPASRADWLAARALLASRRLRPLVPAVALTFLVAIAAILAVRGARSRRPTAPPSTERAAAYDTVPLMARVQAAREALVTRDTALQATVRRATSRVAPVVLSPASRRTVDSLRTLLSTLDGALERAAKAPLSTSYHALADTRALRELADVRALADTLDLLDRARLTLDPVEAPQREFAQLTQRTNAIGSALQEAGHTRHELLARQVAELERRALSGVQDATPPEDTAAVRAARDSVREDVMSAESDLRMAAAWHAAMQARADSMVRVQSERMLGASPMAVAVAALVMTGVLVFTLAVLAEVRRPTIAHAREVERLTGIPVLGTVQAGQLLRTGSTRRHVVAGVDPFHMVYLALTTQGARARTVCVTGDDADLVAALAGRLGVSAATDERATLIVDFAPGTPAVTRYFDERHEPGFSEAIAAVRLWREVARPVGASDGLGLDVVPAGAQRADTMESVALESNRHEFHLFASEYDFTVIAAPTKAALSTVELLCDRPPTIYVARVAQTPLRTLTEETAAIRLRNMEMHGVVLVDSRT